MSEDTPSLKEQVSAALDGSENKKTEAEKVSISEARQAAPLRTSTETRTTVRLLFITDNLDAITLGSKVQQEYADLAQFVGEIHIMVIRTGRGDTKTERPMKNVWIYHVYGRHVVEQVLQARSAAKLHLQFNGVPQPDVVVAIDPLVCGVATWSIARMFDRPWQVHVVSDIFTPQWKVESSKAAYRMARFVLRRASSIRVRTGQIATLLQKQLGTSHDIRQLPHLFNLSAFKAVVATDKTTRFSSFSFVILAEGAYAAESSLHDIFAAVHPLLRNSSVGLLVRGSGPAKNLFVEKAKLLGIEKQVVFYNTAEDPVAHYQAADVFVETGVDKEADERVLRAIAATTPVVTYHNDFRAGFITNNESGFLCEQNDIAAIGVGVRKLLNNNALRTRFTERAKVIAEEQLHEDVFTYYRALRDSITAAVSET